MNILAITHGLGLGGAQISTLEQLELLIKKKKVVDINVLICHGANREFVHNLSLVARVYEVPCTEDMNYPIMDVGKIYRHLEWANIVWITDEIYPIAPQIKKIKNVPVIGHLRSYALICPWWGALYGFREPCLEKCSTWRITRCKQGINLELAKIGLLSGARAGLYWLLDFVKGPLDYYEWSKLMDDVVESIDRFVAVSKALWDIHVRHLPDLNNEPFSVIYNLITEPLRYIRPSPHELYAGYVLYASGSNPNKGPHLLLKSWATVSKEFRDLKLYMIGCKGSWVERLAKRMSLNNVIFFGKLPSDEYYRLIYKARAVVMPSIWPEPFGRIPVEANRLGVPAVVSSAGGLPETIVDGATGYIFKANDVNDLAEKVMKVLGRDFDREEIIVHSYERINPQREVEKLIKFFEDVISHGGGV
jgi:glycosyltransferase involved in cell wall biosynthesis